MSSGMDNYNHNALADHKQNRVRGTEVFVGGLSQSVTEAKIREIFSTCGDILEMRMIKDLSGKPKGYCFLRFATREAASKAVKDKAGIMLEGRKIGVLPSTEQNSLFLGNLPKDWSPDDFDRVVRQVFEDVVSVNLSMPLSDGVPGPGQKRQNRGFGFVHFSSHAAAARAHRMGSKSDFVLGGKSHPTVQWAEENPEVDQEELAKVKVAFIRSLPMDVDEDFLKELFGRYGEIEKVVLSKKAQCQIGFVYFAERSDLENAIKDTNDRTIQGLSAGSFKLQVEVARPLEKSKKRAHESSSKNASDTANQSKLLKTNPSFSSLSGHAMKSPEEPLIVDPYEAAVVSLPDAVKDRLLRILRLGIATRYDIDIRQLSSLKEIPESAAISVLDQFLLSGADEVDKGAFLTGLITKYQVKNLGTSRLPDYISRASDIINVRSDFSNLSARNTMPVLNSLSSHAPSSITRSDFSSLSARSQMPVLDSLPSHAVSNVTRLDYSSLSARSQMPAALDSLSSHAVPNVSRFDSYRPRYSYLDYPLSPRAGISRTLDERNPSPQSYTSSSPLYGRREVNSNVTVDASQRPTRSQVRFDPYTGEPYKFDPFTGEPIQPDSLPPSSRSMY